MNEVLAGRTARPTRAPSCDKVTSSTAVNYVLAKRQSRATSDRATSKSATIWLIEGYPDAPRIVPRTAEYAAMLAKLVSLPDPVLDDSDL